MLLSAIVLFSSAFVYATVNYLGSIMIALLGTYLTANMIASLFFFVMFTIIFYVCFFAGENED